MAGSFEATLSVSDRPELTSLAVTAVPIDPPAVERAAAGDGTTDRRDPEHGVGGKGKNNGNEEDASTGARPEKQRKSSEREESVSDDEDQPDDDGLHAAAKKGMNVVGWWRAKLNANHGLDKEILAALHLLAGARGPCMRLAFSHPVLSQPGDSDARRRNKEGLTKLHREMRAEQKSAVMFLDDPATGRRREVHLAAVWVHPADTAGDTAGDAMGSNGADEAALTTNDEAAPTTNDDGDKADAREPQFLAFEVQPNAPAVALEPLLHKQLMVVFDLDETLLQAFTLRAMERRARELDAEDAGADGGADGGAETTPRLAASSPT